MLLYIFATCCIALSTGYRVSSVKDGPLKDLAWPEVYSFHAISLSLTSGLVEDFVEWRGRTKSRVDYNQGAVTRITLMAEDLSDGDKYEIHPKTTKDEYNKIVCDNIGAQGSEVVKLDTKLPSLSDVSYQYVGSEYILDTDTEKFEAIDDDESNQIRTMSTIWAIYGKIDDTEELWSPLRYEKKVYNDKLGGLKDHVVFEYNDFFTIFNEDVFDVEQLSCGDNTMHEKNSEAVTKELLFMNPEDTEHVDHIFKSYKKTFERQYVEEEHALRRSLLQQSMRLVSSVNRKNLGYKLSINEFADRTPEEMKSRTGLMKRPDGKSGNIPFPYTEATLKETTADLPVEYDLRLLGLVTPVKNQGTCGSCWTFGTTAAVEGALTRVNGGRLMSLANQAIIDCAWDDASGCGGGSDNSAYEWMMLHGLPTDEEYGPYKNSNGYCNIRNMTKLYQIRGYTDVTPFSPQALKTALVNHGPLSVSVEVTDAFALYSSGIYYEAGCGPEKLNHEMSLVGYGERDGELFWILKNSWGPSWGIDGYMYIAARDNNCGVMTEPTFVVL